MMINQHKKFIYINFISFQLAWFIAVSYTDQAIIYLIALLVSHFLLTSSVKADLISLISITLIGSLADYLLTLLGIFTFIETKFIPLWLILLWAHFALALNHSMHWLVKLKPVLQMLFGGIFATLSYYTGSRLDAVTLYEPLVISIVCIAISWAILLPLYIKISHRVLGKNKRGNRGKIGEEIV